MEQIKCPSLNGILFVLSKQFEKSVSLGTKKVTNGLFTLCFYLQLQVGAVEHLAHISLGPGKELPMSIM